MKNTKLNISRDKNGQLLVEGRRALVRFIRNKTKLIKEAEISQRFKDGSILRTTSLKPMIENPGIIGVVVAFQDENRVKFGYSLCNYRSGDKFDRDTAIIVAVDRAADDLIKRTDSLKDDEYTVNWLSREAYTDQYRKVHSWAFYELEAMYYRAQNYFKGNGNV